jgi:hypothetical protein
MEQFRAKGQALAKGQILLSARGLTLLQALSPVPRRQSTIQFLQAAAKSPPGQ